MTGCLTERSLDYSNRVLSSKKDHVKPMVREETHQKENMPFSSQEYAEKLQKENMTLMKALAHRNKIIELSGIEFQKLRINLRDLQDKNLQLAQANSQMLAELNTNRDRLKELQHELGCKNVLLKVSKQHEEQTLPCSHHGSDEKVHNMNHKGTKRKRMSRIKASESSDVEPIHVNEKANSKRKVSGIEPANIPEETCQTEDYIEKGVVSQGTNQIIDNVVNKKFVYDAANPVKASVHSKRQCTRRQSTKFDVQETEETENLVGMDDAKIARPFLRRRSARLRPVEAEACKSLHEGDEIRETIKRRRISSRKQSARFDVQEPEVTETLNADDARSLVIKESTGSRSVAVEPPKNRHDTNETKCRVSTRRQSTKGKSQTEEAIKEIVTEPSLLNNIVHEYDHETEATNKPKADENEGMARRTSVGRPSRGLVIKESTRQSTKGKSQTEEAIKEIVTEPSLPNNIVHEYDHETEATNKPKADENEGMVRRTSVGRPSRHAVEKVQSYREVSLKVKMRRNG